MRVPVVVRLWKTAILPGMDGMEMFAAGTRTVLKLAAGIGVG